MASKKTTTVNEIRDTELPSFRRTQWFETAKTAIQIFLMGILAFTLLVFLVLVIVAGTTYFLPNTEGVIALRTLFVEITQNAKTVVLFALGFFFREYINVKMND